MEYAKDEIFQISYNERKDRLEIKHKNWTRNMKEKIKQNKLLSTVIIAFMLFSVINIIMIYNFINILQNIWNWDKNRV